MSLQATDVRSLALALTVVLSIPVVSHSLTERYNKSLAQYESTALETGVLETGWGDEGAYLVSQNTLHQPYPIKHEAYEREWLRLGGIGYRFLLNQAEIFGWTLSIERD